MLGVHNTDFGNIKNSVQAEIELFWTMWAAVVVKHFVRRYLAPLGTYLNVFILRKCISFNDGRLDISVSDVRLLDIDARDSGLHFLQMPPNFWDMTW